MTINIEELESRGRVYVRYPEDLRSAVEEAVVAWEAFCSLPNDVKLRCMYSGDVKVSGNGYELKLEEGKDLKEDFHLRVSAMEWLLEQAQLVDTAHDSTTATNFVRKALALNALMAETLRNFAIAVEEHYGIPGFAEDVMVRQPSWLLRFLHYFGGREAGEEFAAAHVDKGGFTLHLYEDYGGVEVLTYESREWIALPLPHDQTVIFPGMGLQQRAECTLRALCHRVMVLPETAKDGRYAAVAFINFDHARYWDKKERGRTQDYEPGFFYDMPFSEVNKYFVD